VASAAGASERKRGEISAKRAKRGFGVISRSEKWRLAKMAGNGGEWQAAAGINGVYQQK
jgi:hypothetical protein